MKFHLDYETYSEVDLTVVGAARYASDPSTEIMMFSISDDRQGPFLWVNPKYRHVLTSDPRADAMAMSIKPTDEVWAHSAPFEFFVTKYRWKHDVRLPIAIQLPQWRCTAVLARCAAMPSKLETLAVALGLEHKKDREGKRLIKLFSIPNDITGRRTLPCPALRADFQSFGRYCLKDNDVEKAAHKKLQPFELRGALLDAWIFDLKMNDQGFPVNVEALKHAQKLIDEAMLEVGGKFTKLTGLQPTQLKRVKEFLEAKGLDMEDMKADTVEATLESLDEEHPAYETLRLYSLVQFAAVKKVKSMLDCVCSDGWIRGMLLFYGAGTGRWSGRGVQPQNFKRPTIKKAERVYQMICDGRSREEIELVYGNVLDAMSSCIRNFIQWMDGDMLDADYNAVEARIICWLAGQLDRLSDWERGIDQYKMMAGKIYNRAASSIINPSDEREVGKRTILGCGFQMAGEKFQKTLKEQYGIIVSRELADKCVLMYREMHEQVKNFWYKCQRAAVQAIQHPGSIFKAGAHLSFWVATVNGIKFLFMRLPSGRKIVYPWPEIRPSKKFKDSTEITFFGNIKGDIWGRISTYGGKIAENATQSVAADVMMNGSCKATSLGALIIMLVHDQAPALNDKKLTVEQYTAALTDLPPWAVGLPIKAEGRIIPFYKK